MLRKHGMADTKLYLVWVSMRNRCSNPRHRAYRHYGARGITVCPEWQGDFMPFYRWAIANGYRDGLEIDRIDNSDGGQYSPSNCRFVTAKENDRNKRNNRLLEAFGECKPLAAWLEDRRCVVAESTFRSRLDRGWPIELAITAPRSKPWALRREGLL